MKFRELWEDEIQVETLNLRGLREPREHDRGKVGEILSFVFSVQSQNSFRIRSTVTFNCMVKIPISNKNITIFN